MVRARGVVNQRAGCVLVKLGRGIIRQVLALVPEAATQLVPASIECDGAVPALMHEVVCGKVLA